MNDWIAAAIAVGGGLVIGSVASRVMRHRMLRSKIESVRQSAAAIGGLLFSGCVIVGLLVALGFVSPDDLDRLPEDLIAFLPKAISAAIVVIGGNIAASFAQTAVAKAAAGSGEAFRFAPTIVRFAVLAAALILAAAQVGIDTTVINIAVAALLFGVAASLALLTGLGGRQVAGEVAAGRVWRRSLRPGDHIRAGNIAGIDVDGVVIDIHPTAVEVEGSDTTLFVPNSKLLETIVERKRRPSDTTSRSIR